MNRLNTLILPTVRILFSSEICNFSSENIDISLLGQKSHKLWSVERHHCNLSSSRERKRKMKETPQRSWNARKSHDFQVSFLMAVQQLLLVNGSLQSARTPRDFVGRTTLKLDDSYDIHSFSPIQLFSGGKNLELFMVVISLNSVLKNWLKSLFEWRFSMWYKI